MLRLAEEAGRRTVVLYMGPDFEAVEVDVVAKVHLNQMPSVPNAPVPNAPVPNAPVPDAEVNK